MRLGARADAVQNGCGTARTIGKVDRTTGADIKARPVDDGTRGGLPHGHGVTRSANARGTRSNDAVDGQHLGKGNRSTTHRPGDYRQNGARHPGRAGGLAFTARGFRCDDPSPKVIAPDESVNSVDGGVAIHDVYP